MKILSRFLFLPLCLTVVLAAACSGSGTVKINTDDDIERYMEQMAVIAPLESEALQAYQAVMKDKTTNDADVERVLKQTTIPKLSQFNEQLKNIHPMTEDVITIHRIYLKRTDTMLAAFRKFASAIRKVDKPILQEAIDDLRRGKLYFKQWSARVDKLTKD